MKIFFVFLLTVLTFFVFAEQIKAGEPKNNKKEDSFFSCANYEKAEQVLKEKPFFRTFEDLYKDKKDGLDILFKKDGRNYYMPLFLSYSSPKRSLGFTLKSGNILENKKAALELGSSKDGFYIKNYLDLKNNSFYIDYSHLNFNQRFYKNGWISAPGFFTKASDSNNYNQNLLAEIKTKHDTLSFTYAQQLSSLWGFFITPQYDYYFYENNSLDTGNHNAITFGLNYIDGFEPDITMGSMTEIRHYQKNYLLTDLKRVKTSKAASISYTAGGPWLGADYKINKLYLGGTYLWELKKHHRLALFLKAQRAFSAPFSSEIRSSDLLFGLGIYDREQVGKSGISAGLSFTYFILRNEINLLTLMPFYEQAYVSFSGKNFDSHSGAGAILTYKLWRLGIPININFTKNLNDGKSHIGVKIGGYF